MGSHTHFFCVAAALSLFLLLLPTFASSATAASPAPALPAGSTPKLTLPSPPSSATSSAAAAGASATTKQQQQVATSTTVSIVNSNSVLVALLDSQYTELAELVEKALLLPALEHAVGHHINLTIFAPRNDALDDRNLDPSFRRFLLEPGNLRSLQTLLLSHVLPSRIDAASWPSSLLLPGQYQTEESMYNAVRRFGRVRYDTLRIPHRVVSREADGTVRFGHGEGSAYLVDPDIYTDGRISVQGVDAVLFPPDPEEKVAPATKAIGKKATDPLARSKPAAAAAADDKPRREKQVTCGVLAALGQRSRFTACQHE